MIRKIRRIKVHIVFKMVHKPLRQYVNIFKTSIILNVYKFLSPPPTSRHTTGVIYCITAVTCTGIQSNPTVLIVLTMRQITE